MFANPEVAGFIDKLIGGETPRGGAPPPTQGYRGALARALLGDVTKPSIGGSFSAPPIQLAGGGITPPLPTQGVNRGLGSQELTPLGGSSGGRGGGSGIGAGLGQLGKGIENAAKEIAAKRAAAAQFQGELASHGVSMPSSIGGGATSPIVASPGSTSVASTTPDGPSFPSIGAASDTPIFAQPDEGKGLINPAIGGAGSLPTFAAGAPGGGDPIAQALAGIKAAEGVAYSGKSHTGAIGAYGLTGDFIKKYAPGAGLPTDRASYANNPGLQDQLATYAANQMYSKGDFPGGSFPGAAGSLENVMQAWETGTPHGIPAPGNMSAPAYIAKAMNAAQGQPPPQPTTGAAAYAAKPPSTTQSPSEFASDQQDTTSQTGRSNSVQTGNYNGQPYTYETPGTQQGQSIVPGQTDPHQPGFDPKSVPFINTPLPGEQQHSMNEQPLTNLASAGASTTPQLAPGAIQGQALQGLPPGANPSVDPLALALAGGQLSPLDLGFGGGGIDPGLFGGGFGGFGGGFGLFG